MADNTKISLVIYTGNLVPFFSRDIVHIDPCMVTSNEVYCAQLRYNWFCKFSSLHISASIAILFISKWKRKHTEYTWAALTLKKKHLLITMCYYKWYGSRNHLQMHNFQRSKPVFEIYYCRFKHVTYNQSFSSLSKFSGKEALSTSPSIGQRFHLQPFFQNLGYSHCLGHTVRPI